MMTPDEQLKLIKYLEKREANLLKRIDTKITEVANLSTKYEKRISGLETFITGKSEDEKRALEFHQAFPVKQKPKKDDFVHKPNCPTLVGGTLCLCENNLNP